LRGGTEGLFLRDRTDRLAAGDVALGFRDRDEFLMDFLSDEPVFAGFSWLVGQTIDPCSRATASVATRYL
jgi:hypothetical protein